MPVLMGLLAALGWGVADYLASVAARAAGVYRTAFFTQLVGWLAVSAMLLAVPALWERAAAAPWVAWGQGLLAVSCNLAGSLLLLHALSVGRAALVAPLATGYAAITALLGVAAGEALGAWRLLGVCVCLAGAPLTTMGSGKDRPGPSRASGVASALGSALCFGIGFRIQGAFAIPGLGAVPTLWLFFGLGVAVLGPVLAARRGGFRPPPGAWPLLLVQSLLGLMAYGCFAWGMAIGSVTVVTVLSTLAAGVTALLGLTLRRERLNRPQWLGITAVICGVILLRSGA